MCAGFRRTTLTALAMAIFMASVSCGDLVRQGRAPAFLVIDLLRGASGAQSASFSGMLESDVVTNVTQTIAGVQTQVPTIFEDVGAVQLRILLKDQGNPGAVAGPSNINMITVSAVATTVFLGGYYGPFGLLPGPWWFFLKVFLLLCVFVWIRATLPRLRYDRLMKLGWTTLLPLGLLNVFATAVVLVLLNRR